MELPPADPGRQLDRLRDFLERHRRVLVITGAGCSAPSGLPPYRNAEGDWQHPRPILYQDFLASGTVRRRYWYRSRAGWPRFAGARPNAAHHALATLEAAHRISSLITQNVDGLHQAAGSRTVVDLHGRLDRVRCLGCGQVTPRSALQAVLTQCPDPPDPGGGQAGPDGDAVLDGVPPGFEAPACPACGGILKPDVVFFGEAVPPAVTAAATAALESADALLVVGSSLMVFSGYRLVRDAARAGLPVAAITLGRTRADEFITLAVHQDCSRVLPALLPQLDRPGPGPLESIGALIKNNQ